MVTSWLIRVAQRQAKKPLPTRRFLLAYFAIWSVLALWSALTIGIILGKSWWHTPFALQGVSKRTPFLWLSAAVFSAQTCLQRVLDGAYRGGELDREKREGKVLDEL